MVPFVVDSTLKNCGFGCSCDFSSDGRIENVSLPKILNRSASILLGIRFTHVYYDMADS